MIVAEARAEGDRLSEPRWIYPFAEGSAEMRELLGNKGANLAEMTRVLGADRVPGGFTITTAACVEYMRTGEFPAGLEDELTAAVARLEHEEDRGFGDAEDPLLLSVRSGAPVSMPGMLDTILNLGLTEKAVTGLARRGDERFARDSRRRLLQMFGEVVRGVPADLYERELTSQRQRAGVASDGELDAAALRQLDDRFASAYREHTGERFPEDPHEQLLLSVRAVFDSWGNERAATYRHLNGIPDDLGTAVTVQRMVFGNLGDQSGAGVAFSRDPTDGDPNPDGDFLTNAQGEDVVAGVRNTETLDGLAARMPDVHAELVDALARLERHYGDIQDVEYTVEDGRLFILQTRSAKRHALAAVRFAVDAVAEGMLDREQALRTIDPGTVGALLHRSFDPAAKFTELTRGVGASPGAAKGGIVFSPQAAEERAAAGEDVILVRPFTSADDVGGFDAARGILTAQGGKSSHAAIVARGMGRPCVCGASELRFEDDAVRIGELTLHAGDAIAIDGTTGTVTADDVALVEPQLGEAFTTVLGWADEFRRLGVRANADTGPDAARARELGAEGVGLCRTEHMFFGDDRERLVREMFIAAELERRGEGRGEELGDALRRLGELQRGDFAEILRAMNGLPVTIRLLDPPLHEFIDPRAFERDLDAAQDRGDEAAAERARRQLEVAAELEEVNPMLGTRGVRLGLMIESLYAMQVRAVVEATERNRSEGLDPRPEIMIPLVAVDAELAAARALVEGAIVEAGGDPAAIPIGTMIELPRACLVAGELAERAEFFSFGTNDLTQTTLGLSRDDAEGGFLPTYLSRGILPASPFETIDTAGVGELVRIAAERGRAARPGIVLGICGEHGGDPASVRFFDAAGLDYVSCSPFRVPVARIAAALAALDR